MIEFDSAVQPTPRGATPQAEPKQASQSWLREWEQARWQEQPRYEAQAQHDGSAQPAPETPAAAVAATAGAAQPAVESQAANIARQDMTGGGESVIGLRASLANARSVPNSLPTNAAFAMALAATSRSLAAAAKAARLDTPAAETTAAEVATSPEWAAHSVHVHVGDQATSVWIRDANLTAQQALALLERLRPGLHTPGSAALPLHLTLNGQAVAHEPLKHTPTR